MTPKQEERIRNKIKKIKAALAADKKRWGGYHHDGQGLRYSPPRYYIELSDFTGGLRYLNWFTKNFPDDAGFPDFLFEWSIILFKTKRLKEAQKKVFEAFMRNTYILDKFFGRPVSKIEKWEGSNLEVAEFAIEYFGYSHQDKNLTDFSEWLDKVTQSDKFLTLKKKYIDINIKLKTEQDFETRGYLIKQIRQLESDFE